MFTFFLLVLKYLSLENLTQNIKIVRKIWYLDQFEYEELNSVIHFFCFKLPFLDKFGPKSPNF